MIKIRLLLHVIFALRDQTRQSLTVGLLATELKQCYSDTWHHRPLIQILVGIKPGSNFMVLATHRAMAAL